MGNEKYTVIVSDRAKHMLGMHIRFMAPNQQTCGCKIKEEIMNAMRSLQKCHVASHSFNEPYIPVNKYHKMYVPKWYLILYQVQDNTVYVDYILDCREDYSWLIR